jgi:carboxypeptidase PM20D1
MPTATKVKIFKRAAAVGVVGVLGLVGVLLIRTARFGPKPLAIHAVKTATGAALAVDIDLAADHLGGAIRIPTVAHRDPSDVEIQRFVELHEYLKATFPEAARRLRWESVDTASLLLTWEGTDPSLKPLLLAAHLDVVPAVPEQAGGEARPAASPMGEPWEDRAFSGRVDATHIWGRGTLDDKVSVLGIIEAVEALLKQGYHPRRTVLLAFGGDEEIGGAHGARRIAAELLARGVHPECVLDEGSEVLEGIVPGISVPVAAVGIAEKGYVDVALSVATEGGHSSMPPPHTAIGILGRAIVRLEDHPYRARLDGITWQTLEALGPELPFGPRLALANTWLLGPLVERQLAASSAMNALIRTSTAVTIVRGGERDNVLPRSALAVVNFRLLPGDTSQDLLAHVVAAVADPRVNVGFADPRTYAEVSEASRVAPIDSAAYATIHATIRRTFPDALVVPTLVIAGTDARHYEGLTANVYRFLPVRLLPADLERIHGIDERIALKDYARAIRFYGDLIRNFDESLE